MNILEIKNLNLGFNLTCGYRQAINNISFSLNKGEILSIVGESGCGKTLTAMSILKLLPQNCIIRSGEILYKNENILKKNEKELQKIRGGKIALIPQDPMTSLNPLYTIENQMMEVLNIHQPNVKDKKELIINSLKSVQITDPIERLNAYPHELSGGMKQRVIIAMALSCNADIIIADEPTTALDVTVQEQIMNLFLNIKEKNNTSIIFITHDLALVSEYADKVVVMYAGNIVEYSDKKDLFTKPLHPYTKALLKAVPNMKSSSLVNIEGMPPTLEEKIEGCPFYSRCKYKMEKCLENNPDLKNIDKTKVACFKY